MSLTALDQTKQRVLMFGGKGGVGKTTSSAATALHYALAGRKTLIIGKNTKGRRCTRPRRRW